MKTLILNRRRRGALLTVCAATIAMQLCFGQKPAELLEKAIYSEETKGDYPAAIALYEQAIKEAKSTESLAAQALYRLGMLHFKQGNPTKGTAIFEELLEKHPGETELIASARQKLPAKAALGPVPWSDGELMILHFRFPAGLKIGLCAYRATLGEHEGRPAWVVGNRTFAGVNSYSAVHADVETFRPMHSFWKHALIGEAEGEFKDQAVLVKNLTTGSNQTVDLAKPVYDNEQVVHVMRRLPLALGFKTTFDIITTLGGGTVIPLGIEVSREEEITTPAGTFKCWRVDLSVKQSFWYSADDRRLLVKMEAGGVIGELVEVRQLVPGRPNVHRNDELGFSFSAPGDWLVFDGASGEEKNRTRIALLDFKADASSVLFAFPLQSLPQDQRSSLKAWAESRAKEGTVEAAGFKVRPDSWKDFTLGGFPAISFVADFTEGPDKKAMAHYSVVLFRGAVAAHFFLNAPPEKLAKAQEPFDAIVESFNAK